jgi:hypothetical protein
VTALEELKRETASRDYLREADGKLTRKDVPAREWRIVQMASRGLGQFSALGAHASDKPNNLAEDQEKAFEQIVGPHDFVTMFREGRCRRVNLQADRPQAKTCHVLSMQPSRLEITLPQQPTGGKDRRRVSSPASAKKFETSADLPQKSSLPSSAA